MAVEAHHPRAAYRARMAPGPRMEQPKAAARGLAVWLVPEEGTSPELLAHAARMVLARALECSGGGGPLARRRSCHPVVRRGRGGSRSRLLSVSLRN